MKRASDRQLERALLREVDRAFQRYYHQTLNDIVQDLTLRSIIRHPDPPPDTVLRAIHQTKILEMNSAAPVAVLCNVLERYARGKLGSCTRCGRSIARRNLLQRPSLSMCTRCQKSTASLVPS